MHKIAKIQKQIKNWLKYGWIIPIIFSLGMFSLYGILNASTLGIFYGSWLTFILVSLIWWLWTIRIINEMAKTLNEVASVLSDVKKELKSTHDELKNTRQS